MNAALLPKPHSRFPPLEESKCDKVPPASCRSKPGYRGSQDKRSRSTPWVFHGSLAQLPARVMRAHEAAKPDLKLASCGDGTTSHTSIRAVSTPDNTQREHSSPTFASFFFTCHKQGYFLLRFQVAWHKPSEMPSRRREAGTPWPGATFRLFSRSPASAHLSHQKKRTPRSRLRPP